MREGLRVGDGGRFDLAVAAEQHERSELRPERLERGGGVHAWNLP
jgi:hypothetical protein